MKGKVAPTKSTTKAYVLFCFSLSAVVSPALYRFFIDSETNETIPLHFRNFFHFFSDKNSLSKTLLVECVRSGAANCNKRREFWRKTHTPLWILIGRIFFFFTCENHRWLLWLARTNLRTKIYDIASWWVFFSMYIINIDFFMESADGRYLRTSLFSQNERARLCERVSLWKQTSA